MSIDTPDVPPPPAELATLFDGERGYEELPHADVRARILAGVRLRALPPEGSDPGGSGPGAASGAAPGASIATSKAIAGMIATFVFGGLLGAAVMRVPTPVAPSVAPSAAPQPVVATPPASAVSVSEPAAPAITAAAPSSPAPKPASEPTDDGRSVAAERALLDAARIALASGEPTQALDVVARHAREYPRGRLAEEREAIAVRALVKAGRYDEARSRAERFQSVYPRSVAAPAVSAAIHSIP